MVEQPSLKVLRAWNELRDYNRFAGQEPVLGQGGEYNDVLLLPDSVIRVPRVTSYQAMTTVWYESEVCMALNDAALPPPFAIPQLVEAWYDTAAPYFVTTRLPGRVLLQREVRGLSVVEKAAFGRALGAFVAWYANALPLETCNEFIDMTTVEVPNRMDAIRRCARLAVDAHGIDEKLADVLLSSAERLKQYEATGVLTATITGHDDLRPGNFTFTTTEEGWQPHGAFDFGNTQPSTPERELRHAACLGRSVCEPAVETYQSLTGTSLSEELLDFWAVAQASTVLTYCLVVGNTNGIDSGRASLQTLRPDYDWSNAFVDV